MPDVKKILGSSYESVKRAPLEIRDADAALLARGTVGTLQNELANRLPAGTYTATVVLSPGESIVHHVAVDERGKADVSAIATRIRDAAEGSAAARADAATDASDADGLPRMGRSSADGLAADGSRRPIRQPSAAALEMRSAPSFYLEGMGAEEVAPAEPMYMRLFKGTCLNAPQLDLDALHSGDRALPLIAPQGDTVMVKNRTETPLTLQLLRPSRSPLNIIVPAGCRVNVHRPSGALRPPIDMLFGVAVVDELIDLRTRGALSEAAGVATTLKVSDVLEIAALHPSAAVAACYILLRTGSYEVASKSIKTLFGMLPIRPDLLVLRAELYARIGSHRKAKAGFLAAAHLGIPMACAGLTYLVDRLRFYSQMREGSAREAPPKRDTAPKAPTVLMKELLAMQRVALRCDFNRIFTNYTGLLPAQPGDEVWELNRNADGSFRLIFES
jgi:hypothetical protein